MGCGEEGVKESRPAPRRVFRGRAPNSNECLCPPNENCAPPSEDCALKELTGSGLLECKSRPKLVFGTRIYVIFVDLHRILQNFWDEDRKIFLMSAEKSLWFLVKTFFLWRSPCSYDPDWEKLLVPPCPSQIHINKLLVPPQNLFLPIQSRSAGVGPARNRNPN